jgi:hypothetical protein
LSPKFTKITSSIAVAYALYLSITASRYAYVLLTIRLADVHVEASTRISPKGMTCIRMRAPVVT